MATLKGEHTRVSSLLLLCHSRGNNIRRTTQTAHWIFRAMEAQFSHLWMQHPLDVEVGSEYFLLRLHFQGLMLPAKMTSNSAAHSIIRMKGLTKIRRMIKMRYLIHHFWPAIKLSKMMMENSIFLLNIPGSCNCLRLRWIHVLEAGFLIAKERKKWQTTSIKLKIPTLKFSQIQPTTQHLTILAGHKLLESLGAARLPLVVEHSYIRCSRCKLWPSSIEWGPMMVKINSTNSKVPHPEGITSLPPLLWLV